MGLARLAYLCLAVVAVLGLGASSASASYWDPNEDEHIKLIALPGSTLHVFDHETFGANEVITADLSNTVFGKVWPVRPHDAFTTKLSRCAGGEVRAELTVTGETWTYDHRIIGTAQLRLYEGSDCSTKDLDGVSESFFFSLFPQQWKDIKIPVKNVAEGDDYAVATLKLKAVLADGH